MYWYDHILPRFIVGLGTSALTFPFLDWRIRDKFELSTSNLKIVQLELEKVHLCSFKHGSPCIQVGDAILGLVA